VSDVLRNKIDAAIESKRAEKAKPGESPWKTKPANYAAPQTISAIELWAKKFPPPKFVLDGLVGDGLTVLSGKPKGGKSWLAILLAWAVAAGDAIDGRATWQGEVLYLALEDTQRRLQDRMRKLHAELNWIVPETLTLSTSWPRVDDSALYYIAEWLDARKPMARLVIVDVLAKFRKPQKGSANNYADDYEAVGGLKELVDHYGVSGLFLHHTRKLKAEDPFDEISGTYGVSGPADTLWILDNENGRDARLYVRGRDIAEGTVPMRYTPESGRWVLGPTAEGIDTSGRAGVNAAEGRVGQCRAWVLEYLRVYAFPAKELDEAAKVAGYNPATVKNAKAELGRNGTGQITFRKDVAGAWWVGIGEATSWKWRPPPDPIPRPGGEFGELES
jgi:hypothetical protein